jgi:hypothetical protein
MANKTFEKDSSIVPTHDIGQMINEMKMGAEYSRKAHERRWYDGHHFRYLSRSTNKIIDQSERASMYSPQRAIPKASRQIRGIANLLMSQNPIPTVYPERIMPNQYPPVQQQDPKTGQIVNVPSPQYQQALEQAKDYAKKAGHWLQNEYEDQDIIEKLALMIILAAKYSTSYMQIWPDEKKGPICTQVYDAFDIYLMGNLTEIYDSPFIIKSVPQLITEIQANEAFDQNQLSKIMPDNKLASSDIKEAYQKARFGSIMGNQSKTLIVNEAYLKEYLNEENIYRIAQQDNAEEILRGRKKGDMVIRQVFTAGGTWLKDSYTSLKEYPFVDFRFEPGPIYQVPLIERFIPANKSLDLIVSRLERVTNTMIGGIWLKRQGEQFEINNSAGAQVIEYSATKPEQAQMTPVPSYPFNMISILESFIEEQGVTTATLGKIPPGVRANSAIESLKESEYATLIISTRRLKQCVQRIAENMLLIADSGLIKPKTVYYEEKGQPEYFDVMGSGAMDKMKALGLESPQDVVPIKKGYHVKVEVEAGMAYTKEGQKGVMLNLIDRMISFAQLGFLNPQAVKVVLEKFLQTYQFGATGEFMEAMDDFQNQGNMTDQQIQAMKVAMMEVFKDLTKGGAIPDQETRIQEVSVGVLQAQKDMKGSEAQAQSAVKPPSESISFKDLPAEGKVQMAQKAGIQISPEDVRAQEMANRAIEVAKLSISAQQKKGKPNGNSNS